VKSQKSSAIVLHCIMSGICQGDSFITEGVSECSLAPQLLDFSVLSKQTVLL